MSASSPTRDRFSFQLINLDGDICSIPFHRVRRVYKDGTIIWKRDKHNI
ncbi:MAG TPA: DUF504 domain-containing protein [Desulfobacterales bacterium]|nr:DUF504 domain-containing protein [Desulfobacterales bacterium]